MSIWSAILKTFSGSRSSARVETVKETILEKMPTPPFLTKQIAELLSEIKFRDEEERKWAERNFKTCGLFEGKDVLCRDTDEGTQIIAAGTSKEVATFLRSLSEEKSRDTYIEFPPLWVF